MTITSDGGVGIGTATISGAKLEISGGGIDIQDSGYPRVRFYVGSVFKGGVEAVQNAGSMISTSAVNDLAIRSQSNMLFAAGGNTERMRIDSSGNVGIGTTDPDSQLHVHGVGTLLSSDSYFVAQIQTDRNDDGSNDDGILQFVNGSAKTVKGEIRWDESTNTFELGHGDNQGHLVIASGGNVGIGAISPENSLHIKNNTATNGQMLIQGDANNTYIRMNKSGSTWAIGIDASDSNSFKIGNNTDLSTGTRLTVTTSGKVLINTIDPQDDPSMLRVINSMSNLGGICLGKVHNSTNNNNAAVLVHKLGQGQGFQFSGKFIVNSWTGNRHIDCHITAYYSNDSVSVNSNHVNQAGVSATTVRLCTVNIGGVLYLAFVKNGGGTGVSYLNAFIEGNIHFSGGIQEVLTAGNGYTVTTTHHTF